MRRNDSTVKTAISDQQVAPQAQPQHWYCWVQPLEKGTKVLAIAGLKEVPGRAAHFPTGMVCHRLVAVDRAANSNKCRLLICCHGVSHP